MFTLISHWQIVLCILTQFQQDDWKLFTALKTSRFFSKRATLFNLLPVSDNNRCISLSRRKIGTKLYCIVQIKATSERRFETIYSTENILLFSNRAILFNLLSDSDNIRYISINRRRIETKTYCIVHIKATATKRLETIYSPGNFSSFSKKATLFNLLSVSYNVRHISMKRRKIGTILYCIAHITATSTKRLETIYSPGNISLFFQ